jgi:hypothetical protein
MEKKIEIILHEDKTIESRTYGMTADIEMNMIINTLAHRLYELKLPRKGLNLAMNYITKSLMENITYLKENEIN